MLDFYFDFNLNCFKNISTPALKFGSLPQVLNQFLTSIKIAVTFNETGNIKTFKFLTRIPADVQFCHIYSYLIDDYLNFHLIANNLLYCVSHPLKMQITLNFKFLPRWKWFFYPSMFAFSGSRGGNISQHLQSYGQKFCPNYLQTKS